MPTLTADPRFIDDVVTALQRDLPPVLRWAGAIARQLRQHNIALAGKSSGSRETDALTLADLTVQELLVGALRDCDPIFRRCRIEAEETTGDLEAFTPDSPLTIALDPIDGTKQFRDHTGNGYAVMVHVRTIETVVASLIFVPETGPHGTWLQAYGNVVKCGPDDPRRPARDVLNSLPSISRDTRQRSQRIYLIGFQQDDRARAELVTQAGLEGVPPDDMPGSIYPLLATGEFAGSLIHSPNIYDFPVALHLARIFGGDAVWVHSGEPVHFRRTWLDDRADMLRLPDIVATAIDPAIRAKLVDVARNWNRERYPSSSTR